MPPEDAMFQEVFSAVEQGDRPRARDLLTRLLRRDQANPDYWLWMSAVVDSSKERIYCLNQALRIDPQNQVARRGLTVLGAQPPQEDLIVPKRLQRRSWQVRIEKTVEQRAPLSWKRMLLYGGIGITVVGLLLLAIFGSQLVRERAAAQLPTIDYLPVAEATAAEATQAFPTIPPTPAGPTPPWEALLATYTPTPAYGRTPHPVIEAYSIGMRAFDRQEWDRVITFMGQAAQADPDSADIHYIIGEAHRQQNAFSPALSAYDNAIKTNPKFAPAFLGRARTNKALGTLKNEDLRRDLEIALGLDPNFGEIYLDLAQLDLDEQNYEDALQHLDLAAERLPNSPLVYLYRAQVYLAMDEPEQALTDAFEANRLDITLLDGYLVLGQALQVNNQYPESIVPLDIYLRYHENPIPVAYAWLGRAYAANDDMDAALKAFEQALLIDSANFDVLMQRGLLYLETGEFRKALADFNLAIDLQPTSFAAAIARSRSLLGIEAFGDAYIQLNKIEGEARSDQHKAELYYLRALSLETLNPQAAINDWDRLLELPEGVVSAEWLQEARKRRAALVTPTATQRPSITPTATHTRIPTITRTPLPSTRTPTRTPTRMPTQTRTP
jgi:tetratricopeptide (TPR) repeat protein